MFAVLWFLFIASAIAGSVVWLLDHDGSIVISWLGYEARTDILTAILLTIFFVLVTFVISYAIARILAFRFPAFFKIFFKKTYIQRLEKLVHRHWQGMDVVTQLLMAIEVQDVKSSENLQKKLGKLIKNPQLNNFFLGRIALENKDFSKAADCFVKLGEDKHAKILVLKSKFKLALEKDDEVTAIAYAKQILSARKDNVDVARSLFSLYKKRGMWQEAKGLIAEYGSAKFEDELQKRDIAVINAALAFEAYRKKQFSDAIKHAKISLKAESDFLPAIEILLKSWIKRGFSFKASWVIKKLWRENPHLVLAEIFDLINRKASVKKRIKAVKKLASLNSETPLNKLAIGVVAFRAGSYSEAKDFLLLSLIKEKTYRAYKLLSLAEKFSGDNEKSKKYSEKAEMLNKEGNYSCSNCGHLSEKWAARCTSCASYDSLEWSS